MSAADVTDDAIAQVRILHGETAAIRLFTERLWARAGRGDYEGHPAFTDAEERLIAAEQARRDDWVGDDRRRQQAADNWTERELDERRTR